MIGGAWPFLVRGIICLLNCVFQMCLDTRYAFWCVWCLFTHVGCTLMRLQGEFSGPSETNETPTLLFQCHTTNDFVVTFYLSLSALSSWQACYDIVNRRGLLDFNLKEGWGNNRSVMPLDVPGCTRATMIYALSIF